MSARHPRIGRGVPSALTARSAQATTRSFDSPAGMRKTRPRKGWSCSTVQFSGTVVLRPASSATARCPVTWATPRLAWVCRLRSPLGGIQVHMVIPGPPPPKSVKKPSAAGLSSSSSDIRGIRLIQPSPATASSAIRSVTGPSSSGRNEMLSSRRAFRAIERVSQFVSRHARAASWERSSGANRSSWCSK
jgi:hypothetical protein